MGWIILAIVVLLAIWAVGIYNGLVQARNGYKNAFAQIDVQLTRRHDLVPNLVETAKGYLAHERQTLEAVINARNAAVAGLKAASANPGDPATVQQLAGAENALSGALGRLFALAADEPAHRPGDDDEDDQRHQPQHEDMLGDREVDAVDLRKMDERVVEPGVGDVPDDGFAGVEPLGGMLRRRRSVFDSGLDLMRL